ncbi:MAG: feruloyl-CoA synthase [Myxococcaceae bacterium]
MDRRAVAPSLFATPNVMAERRPDGALLLRSREGLADYEPHLARVLRSWAERTPDAVLATDPTGAQLTYGHARRDADALAQAFLDRGLGPERPLMILSGNSVAHLRVMLGALTAGVPVAPVSVAYSLRESAHHRLRSMAQLVRPGMVFAEDGAAFDAALNVVAETGAQALTGADLEALASTPVTSDVERALAASGPDSIAKILFTSGSTGTPKGVLSTHRMLTANQQMMRQVWPFLRDEPPVLVDWLPWSHTFGGSHNVNLALTNGGAIHVDDGRPAPELFGRTVAALRRTPPTIYVNVPAGFAALVPTLEADRELAARFFSRLRVLFYAAAALPRDLWDRLSALAQELADHEIALTSSWGSTETAPANTSAHFASVCGCIGVPLPGVTLKLAPVGGKLEMRVAGPNVTPGYFARPDLTAAAFDEEGFYRTGDAAQLVDPADPNRGVMFAGRIAEDFKLVTGTWVNVAAVRGELLSAAGGVLSEVVVCGHDRAEVTALGWLNPVEAARIAGVPEGEPVTGAHPSVRRHLAAVLRSVGADRGSSARVRRLLLCAEPPRFDAGEITDKGYVNQRVVLERRAGLVATLYAPTSHPDVIEADV